jgi:hypothetical protein
VDNGTRVILIFQFHPEPQRISKQRSLMTGNWLSKYRGIFAMPASHCYQSAFPQAQSEVKSSLAWQLIAFETSKLITLTVTGRKLLPAEAWNHAIS